MSVTILKNKKIEKEINLPPKKKESKTFRSMNASCVFTFCLHHSLVIVAVMLRSCTFYPLLNVLLLKFILNYFSFNIYFSSHEQKCRIFSQERQNSGGVTCFDRFSTYAKFTYYFYRFLLLSSYCQQSLNPHKDVNMNMMLMPTIQSRRISRKKIKSAWNLNELVISSRVKWSEYEKNFFKWSDINFCEKLQKYFMHPKKKSRIYKNYLTCP